jgi:hypothetical protein
MRDVLWDKDPVTPKMPIVRSTLYLATKVFSGKLLLEDRDRIDLMNRSLQTLRSLVDCRNEDEMFRRLSRLINYRYHRGETERVSQELQNLHFLTKVFYQDSNWDSIYRKAILKLMENSLGRDQLIDALEKKDQKRLEALSSQSYEQIQSMAKGLSELQASGNALKKSQDRLRRMIYDTYVKLSDFLAGLDLSLVSPDARSLVQRIEMEMA